MHNICNICKERQGLKVTEQMVCYQARVIRMNGWLTELEMNVIKKSTVNENADKIVAMMIMMIKVGLQKINENLVNVLQNLQNNVSLSFENVE